MKIKITSRSRTSHIPVRFGPPKVLVPAVPKKPASEQPADSLEPISVTPPSLSPAPSPEPSSEPELEPESKPEPTRDSPKPKKSKKSQKPKHPRSKRAKIITRISYVVAIVFVALLVFSGLKIYQWFQDDQANREQQEAAAEDADGQEVASEGELVNPPEAQDDDYWYYAKMPFYEVNFADLLAKNPDTVAYIHMDGSYVNYPVVQTTDNDYYLFHAFDRSYNDAGWVFMDYRSTLPSDNTVIYGHGRWNGTVFGTLKNALDPSWQQNKDNYAIMLSTPAENYVYQIFAVYVVPAENYYLKQTFASPEDKANWIATMKSRNVAPVDVNVTPSDHILTLSTCLDDLDNRVVVQARLIKRQPR